MELILGAVCIICFLVCVTVFFFLSKRMKKENAGTQDEILRLNNLLVEVQTERNSLKQQHEAEKRLLNEKFDQERMTLRSHEAESLKHQTELFEAEKEQLSGTFDAERASLIRQRETELTAKEKEILALREQYESKLAAQKELASSQILSLKNAFETEKKTLLQSMEEVKVQFARSLEEMQKEHQTRIALMKEEFKNLSDSILEEKSEKLHDANKKQLESIITPLSEKMGEFRTAVEESKTKGIELNAALTAQLGKMMEETHRIGGEAKELVNALRGQQKTQGDWGELILEEILQKSGLQNGVHYERQAVIKDASGKTIRNEESEQTMRPDVIVHYPDGKDVIIDSKVSLTAYVDYMNAEDESARNDACQRHIRSVKSHVEELIRKDYSAYLAKSNRETVDFVIMFIPNEGPFHLAMISEPTLWTEAFRKKVLIVSPVNLMALLKIIHIAWSRDEQNRNQQAILDTASELLDRLYAFYSEFDAVGAAIDSVAKKYDEAAHRLKQNGRNRSVVLSGEKLKKLGVRMIKAKKLPDRLQPDLEPGSLALEQNALSLEGGETEEEETAETTFPASL